MEEKRVSNYDRLCEEWRQKFLQMDTAALVRRLPGIKDEGDRLTMLYFGREYAVQKSDGVIVPPKGDGPVSNTTKLNFYNLFWYSKETAFFRNRWVPFRDVKNAGPFAPAFQRNVLEPFARAFSGRTAQLLEAARQLGAQRIKQGDAGFVLHAFACIPMQFLFWDGDEEFPAQANILFDYSVTDYIHEESTVSLATDGITFLMEAAGVEPEGSRYRM